MQHQQLTLEQLKRFAPSLPSKKALVGIDGFVDKIVHPVAQRNGPGQDFTRIETITDFGARISSAAGKSANLELAPVFEKLGGNGPLMANAQLCLGAQVRYVGALGKDSVHPLFSEFATSTQAISLAEPGVTHAAEFKDGKIMFGSTGSLETITFPYLLESIGLETLVELFSTHDSISMVNWTMIPYLSEVFEGFLDQVLPAATANPERLFFFDLADPEKRSREDLLRVLKIFSRFEQFGKVVLGLNYREAEQVDELLGFEPLPKSEANLKTQASRIREALALDTVVVHPVECAVCADAEGAYYAEGPFCDNPKITTGAGDHFNAGFLTARLMGLSPEAALTLAVATSGFYVRNAVSPTLENLNTFIQSW
jgi:sugar/nucleoside kinase (ribokinase family)